MDNTHNKSELIHFIFYSLTFQKYHITVVQCDNDADTSIVRLALTDVTDDCVEISTIFYLRTSLCMVIDFTGAGRRCRFADNAGAPLLKYKPFTFFTMLKGSYNLRTAL